MIEYGPDGVRRATYLDVCRSRRCSAATSFRRPVVGGYTAAVKAAR